MEPLATITVKLKAADGQEIVINATDFDPELHEALSPNDLAKAKSEKAAAAAQEDSQRENAATLERHEAAKKNPKKKGAES
mgnify:CR=1 FL=1|jgi:hypothetical protein